MKGISLMVIFLALESITSLISINTTRVNSELVIWRAREWRLGAMVEDMMVISRMERKMVRAHSSGQMELSILEVGRTVFNTVLVSFITIAKMGKRNKVNGRMVKE